MFKGMKIYKKTRTYLAVFVVSTTFAAHPSALKVSMTAGHSAVPSAGSGGDSWKASDTSIATSTTSSLAVDVVESRSDVVVSRAALVQAANDVCERFEPRAYHAPLWAKDAHVSTIFGSGEIQKKIGIKGPQMAYRRERWSTPDGDFIHVDFLDIPGGQKADSAAGGEARQSGANDDDSAPFAVLTHGLESTSTAPLTTRMALAYQREGFRVAVMCFRSCSGEDNLGLGAYHLGFTNDLELVCKTLRERHPNSPLFLSGFSLGGNVITKFLGQLGGQARELGIIGGAVACVPFDAVSCQERLDAGFGKAVYARNFLTTLIPKMMRKLEADPSVAEIIDYDRLQQITTIGEFDDTVIAPIYGFNDYQDYYRKNQAGQFLKGVRVPLLAVQARNDPFMDPDKLPMLEDLEGASVRLSYHESCLLAIVCRDRGQRYHLVFTPYHPRGSAFWSRPPAATD